MFVAAAILLLGLERLCYIWVSRAPQDFMRYCGWLGLFGPAGGVQALRSLFVGFKALQVGVFLAWCHVHGNGVLWPPPGPPGAVAVGATLIAVGQFLNASVFHRLGSAGVFYGNRFGYQHTWCQTFPFTWLDHPQYVGAVLSIWGCFVLMRFPQPDWYLLPAVETIYYALGARFEQDRRPLGP